MLFFHPFRAFRLLTLGPRVIGRTILHQRFHPVRTAILIVGLAALISYFSRRKEPPPVS